MAVQILSVFCAVTFIWRIILTIRLSNWGKNKRVVIWKFIFGLYALEALLPIFRTGHSAEEVNTIRKANIILSIFYISFFAMISIILIRS